MCERACGIHLRSGGLVLALALALAARADDWPTYQHDSSRSAISMERLSVPLSAEWVFTSTHPPAHAWGDPQPKPVEGNLELPRLRFDDAFHVVATGDMVLFGSSADHTVYALDAATGEIRWRYVTGGPVRFAPTLWKGRAYVGSDDGKAYCLEVATGAEVWTFVAAPTGEKVLGNGQMTSVWPVRTSIVVEDGIAYFGAGVFPAEGEFLYAVRASDGTMLWKNDTYGRGGHGGITPQGYLLASSDKLFMPSGRTMPAAFSRTDGSYLFQRNFSWRDLRPYGGTNCLLAGDLLFAVTEQMLAVNEANGGLVFTEDGRRLLVDKRVVYMLTGTEAVAVARDQWLAISKSRLPAKRRINSLEPQVAQLKRQRDALVRKKVTPAPALLAQLAQLQEQLDAAVAQNRDFAEQLSVPTAWRVPCTCTDSMILTRELLFVGGEGVVKGFDVATGKEAWSAEVSGKARGMAAAAGRLLVSTDRGSIHCFVAGQEGKGRRIAAEISEQPFPEDELTSVFATMAEEIVAKTGVNRGFALVLGGGVGRLALELSKRTELTIHAVEPDAESVARAREVLSEAGVYGARVVVMRGDLDALPFADYFANLVVCSPTPALKPPPTPPAEVLRVLKPCGGVAIVGQGSAFGPPSWVTTVARRNQWLTTFGECLKQRGETESTIASEGRWAVIRRGRLNGAGNWTHQYANAGNTACSDDELVQGAMGLLWFGEPGPGRMPSRHASAAAPLSVNGRLLVQGENVVMAYDAYNGLPLWQREIPGALRLGLKQRTSNLAADDDNLFVVAQGKCLRLDAGSGKTAATYRYLATDGGGEKAWGQYLACVDGLLYGSHGENELFALDVGSGKLRWAFAGQRIMATTICIGDGRVYFVDYGATDQQKEKCLAAVDHKQRIDRLGEAIPADVRRVVALDAATGKQLWETPQYVSDCVKVSKAGGELIAMCAKNVLVLCGQPWNGHFWKEFFAGEFSRRSLIALSGSDGRVLWSGRKGYRSRPLIVGDSIIAEPWSHDLRTGKATMRTNPLTGKTSKWQLCRPGHHCGNIAAAPNALFFRSGTAAYYDLTGDYGTVHFGGQRPGCWINCVPAGGVVSMPEASSGCVCPFSLACTTTFYPRQTSRAWGLYSAEGSITPMTQLAVNFGARGDRRGTDGVLWLAYPRPRSGRLVLDLKMDTTFRDGGGFHADNADFIDIKGTADPWLFGSGARGLQTCIIPVAAAEDGPALYTVRLFFADRENDRAGQRVFDIALQGEAVTEGFDIIEAAGASGTAVVKEFKGVKVDGRIEIALAGTTKGKETNELALLHGLELVRERVLSVGLAVPSLCVSDADGHITGTVRLANHTGKTFEGQLHINVPEMLAVEPATRAISLATGESTSVPLTLRVNTPGARQMLELDCELRRVDETVEIRRQAPLEYLGPRGRRVFTPAADAHVVAGSSGSNNGVGATLAVDGGSGAMADAAYSVAYLRFKLDIPGKPVSAVLRLFVPAGGHTQSKDSGVIKLTAANWDERQITYKNAPERGAQIGVVGRVDQGKWVERKLEMDLSGLEELSLALEPTSCDGATYVSREGAEKPQLVVEYEAAE